MKVGTIIKSNTKGQIVIPKKMRDSLGIHPNAPLNLILAGNGIYLYPIKEVIIQTKTENSYLDLLKFTQGTWKDNSWPSQRKKRKQIELKASLKRKQTW